MATHIPPCETSTITCQLDARSDGTFELCVMPHSDPSWSMIRKFDAPGLALRHHSELLRRLRQDGWAIVDHGDGLTIRAAA